MCVLTCTVHICEQGEGEKGNNVGVKMPEAIVDTIFISASLQVYILLQSLGEMQINIGFSAHVMPFIQNSAEALTSLQRCWLVLPTKEHKGTHPV